MEICIVRRCVYPRRTWNDLVISYSVPSIIFVSICSVMIFSDILAILKFSFSVKNKIWFKIRMSTRICCADINFNLSQSEYYNCIHGVHSFLIFPVTHSVTVEKNDFLCFSHNRIASSRSDLFCLNSAMVTLHARSIFLFIIILPLLIIPILIFEEDFKTN